MKFRVSDISPSTVNKIHDDSTIEEVAMTTKVENFMFRKQRFWGFLSDEKETKTQKNV